MKRLLSLLGDMRSALLAFISHPPPLAGGGKNSRQRIFGGWKKFGGLRELSTPRDCAVAHSHPPPQAAEGKKHKRLSLFLLATMLSANPAWAQAPVAPTVASESYILMDAETGTVLAEKNADLRLPPASLTKIMTAHLGFWALEQGVLQKEQEITVSRRAWGAKSGRVQNFSASRRQSVNCRFAFGNYCAVGQRCLHRPRRGNCRG